MKAPAIGADLPRYRRADPRHRVGAELDTHAVLGQRLEGGNSIRHQRATLDRDGFAAMLRAGVAAVVDLGEGKPGDKRSTSA